MSIIKYIFFSVISLIMLYSLSACCSNTSYTTDTSSTFPSKDTTPTTDSIGEENMKSLVNILVRQSRRGSGEN